MPCDSVDMQESRGVLLPRRYVSDVLSHRFHNRSNPSPITFYSIELIPLYETEPTAGTGKRKPKALLEKDKATDDGKTRTLDRFAFKPKASVSASAEGDAGPASVNEAGGGDDLEDVVMNDDGTMTLDSL